ncbi:agmatinase [bacterium]|nr:agmatinase [bacterium]RQV93651.1 MAG: agmatinase [bacterium]
MKLYSKQFLGLDSNDNAYEDAAVLILPIPYEGGISYRIGTARAPDAVLEASNYLELYDEVLKEEPYRMGIATLQPPQILDHSEKMIKTVYQTVRLLLKINKTIVLLGGDHSITTGCLKAHFEKYPALTVIQLDAHADLRDSYNGSRYSHACIMSRIREITTNTLQLGIRSLSKEEAERIQSEKIALYTMDDYRTGQLDIHKAIRDIPEPVYITLDVDVFDWSVIASTGTPEPGGWTWNEGLTLIRQIFTLKNVIGFDIVELSFSPNDHNSPFAVAKLIYKMLGFKLQKYILDHHIPWPSQPSGPIFK